VDEGPSRAFDFCFHLPAEHPVELQGRRAWASHPDAWNLSLDFLVPDEAEIRQETGFIARTYGTCDDAPVVVLSLTTQQSFALVSAARPVKPGAVTGQRGELTRIPAVWTDAGEGTPLPSEQAVAFEIERGGTKVTFLWCEPGYGEKCIGDWATDGDWMFAASGPQGPSPVYARNASCVSHGGKPVAWKKVTNQAEL